MAINWDTILYGPVAAQLGVTGVFVLDDTAGTTFTFTDVHDMSSGAMTGHEVQLDTFRPAVDIRASALTAQGLTPDDLMGATLTMAGKNWIVKSHLPLTSPAGEAQGEYRLVLEEE